MLIFRWRRIVVTHSRPVEYQTPREKKKKTRNWRIARKMGIKLVVSDCAPLETFNDILIVYCRLWNYPSAFASVAHPRSNQMHSTTKANQFEMPKRQISRTFRKKLERNGKRRENNSAWNYFNEQIAVTRPWLAHSKREMIFAKVHTPKFQCKMIHWVVFCFGFHFTILIFIVSLVIRGLLVRWLASLIFCQYCRVPWFRFTFDFTFRIRFSCGWWTHFLFDVMFFVAFVVN